MMSIIDQGRESPDTISTFLQKYNRKRFHVLGDGNCLFRAISHQLFGSDEIHFSVRSLLQRFENLNADIFSPFLMAVNKPTMEEHIKYIGNPCTWGTHLEMLAVATYYKLPVYYVCEINNESMECMFKWNVIKPLCADLRYPVLTDDDDSVIGKTKSTHVEIVNYCSHYDSIVCNDTNTTPELEPILCGEVNTNVIEL